MSPTSPKKQLHFLSYIKLKKNPPSLPPYTSNIYAAAA